MIEVTDEMIEAFDQGWRSAPAGEAGSRRRGGLEAVFAIVNAQATTTHDHGHRAEQDQFARSWAIERAISTLTTTGQAVTSTAVIAAAENYFNYVKGNQA